MSDCMASGLYLMEEEGLITLLKASEFYSKGVMHHNLGYKPHGYKKAS